MFIGLVIAAAGFFLMYYIQSEWLYFVAWGILAATGVNVGVTIPIDKLLTEWFIKKRGLVMGLKFALMGVSAVIIVPIVSWLVQNAGWRMTCVIWGILTVACVIVVGLYIRPKRPEYYGLLPDGVEMDSSASIEERVLRSNQYADEVQETQFTLKEASKTVSFWLLLLANAFHITIQGGVTVHLVPYLTDTGLDPMTAGFLLSLMIFFTIPSRLLAGIVADRVKKDHMPAVMASSHFLVALGLAVILISPGNVATFIFIILFGFGSGIFQPMQILIKGRFFGSKSFGSTTGLTSLVSAPIGLLAPVYSGWIYDTTHSYSIAFITYAAVMIVSTIVMLFTRPPKKAGV
jgi:cyanate permease